VTAEAYAKKISEAQFEPLEFNQSIFLTKQDTLRRSEELKKRREENLRFQVVF